jgi:Flp pilus assembly protein TadG
MRGTNLVRKPGPASPSTSRAITAVPVRARPGGRGSHLAAAQGGQTLVEFAMVLTVFMLLTLGLLDGMRVVFYYSQVQEAAREGARWGAIQVARAVGTTTPWGTFSNQGNAVGTYANTCPSSLPVPPCYPLTTSRTLTTTAPLTNTIVGAATLATTAVNLSQATITISTSIPAAVTETLQTNDQLTNNPVTVTVSYPFKPILGMVFGGVTINVKGSSTMLHE